MKFLDWLEWEPHYRSIVSELNLDSEADERATSILDSMLKDQDSTILLRRLESVIANRKVVICGAGPSLLHHLEEMMSLNDASELVYVAADGAVSALLEKELKCDILVTDLDGRSEDLEEVVKRGALAIVHAHGDNIDMVKRLVPILKPVLGSTQVKPTKNVFLWGGFTDGDRACYITTSYNPSKIILAGMDFGEIVGPWSKPDYQESQQATNRKRIKLGIAQKLITKLMVESDLEFTLMK